MKLDYYTRKLHTEISFPRYLLGISPSSRAELLLRGGPRLQHDVSLTASFQTQFSKIWRAKGGGMVRIYIASACLS